MKPQLMMAISVSTMAVGFVLGWAGSFRRIDRVHRDAERQWATNRPDVSGVFQHIREGEPPAHVESALGHYCRERHPDQPPNFTWAPVHFHPYPRPQEKP